ARKPGEYAPFIGSGQAVLPLDGLKCADGREDVAGPGLLPACGGGGDRSSALRGRGGEGFVDLALSLNGRLGVFSPGLVRERAVLSFRTEPKKRLPVGETCTGRGYPFGVGRSAGRATGW